MQNYNLACFIRVSCWSLILREEHKLEGLKNNVLRYTFGHNRQEVRKDWRYFHNEELHKLCSLPDVGLIWMINGGEWDERSTWHVKWGTTNAYESSVEKSKGTDLLEDLETDVQIILKHIFKKYDVKLWNKLLWVWIGHVARLLCTW